MKTKEELNFLKSELEALNVKLAELSEDELKQVTGGQAVLPLLSNEEIRPSADNIVGVNRFGLCGSCGETVAFPATGHGYCKCGSCGAMVKY